jgi:hypothetical protein
MGWNQTSTNQAKFPTICQASWLQTNQSPKHFAKTLAHTIVIIQNIGHAFALVIVPKFWLG